MTSSHHAAPGRATAARYRFPATPARPARGSALGRLLAPAFILAALPTAGRAQDPTLNLRPPADQRPPAVERGLTTQLRVRGREPERFTIQERMGYYRVPGMAVVVIEGDSIAWARTYGVADAVTGEPVTSQTLFQAASISKPVAAMAALRLVERGVLELDSPVNRYLVGWQIPDNEYTARQPVTLRHLLTHTGGLTVHGFPGYAVDDSMPTVAQILDGTPPANTGAIRVNALPGSAWRYSGGGYTILQKLLSDVTGKSFPELMRELVLDPAGMLLSTYAQPLPPTGQDRAASGHLGNGGRVDGEWHLYPEMAAAGLWTTPVDLAHLALQVRAAWRGEPGRLLSQQMARQALTAGLGNQGLGFAVRAGEGPTRFGHGGSNHGFKAQLDVLLEEGQGVVVMTNGDQGSALAQEIRQAVAEVYRWPGAAAREVDVVALAPELLARAAGRFRPPDGSVTLRMTVQGDHLLGLVEERGDQEAFYPLSETRFIGLSSAQEIEMVLDAAGRVTALTLGGRRANRVEG